MSHIDRLFVATKAIVEYKGKILIVRESAQNPVGTNPNKFDIVGGRIEPGETWEACLRREVLEETGLNVKIGSPFFVQEWRPIVKDEKWQVVGIFFACRASTDAVELSIDHDMYTWIDPKEYKKEQLIENLFPVFEAYLAR